MNATTIETPEGRVRVNLPKPLWEGSKQTSPGISLTGLWYGPRSRRMFARYYSIFENRNTHEHEGEYYRELNEHEFSGCCECADIVPPIPAAGNYFRTVVLRTDRTGHPDPGETDCWPETIE